MYAVPAEATWQSEDNTHHSIFADVEGFDIDFARFDLAQWQNPAFEWEEGRCAELSQGWVAYDPTGEVSKLIAERTSYNDALRIKRLDEAITWLDQHLGEDGPEKRWQTLGPVIAHDRLNAAYHYLVDALFATNRQWRPWRNREMSALLQLDWLPDAFDDRVLTACVAPSQDRTGYFQRVDVLKSLFADILAHLQAEGFYNDNPISMAFIRANEEPGRAWNIEEWQTEHNRRHRSVK